MYYDNDLPSKTHNMTLCRIVLPIKVVGNTPSMALLPIRHNSISNNTLPNKPMVPISPPLDPGTLGGWYKHHLSMLAVDKLKLHIYQKLFSLPSQFDSGFIKCVVSDLVSFGQTACVSHPRVLEHVGGALKSRHKLDVRAFYVQVAYMMFKEPESKIEQLADSMLELYLELRDYKLTMSDLASPQEKVILRLATKYYKSCNINYRLMYDHKSYPRNIHMADESLTISLPPLPQIKSKHLLAKALMHKELYRAVFLEEHEFHKSLVAKNINVDRLALNVIRYDLSFLDGLGDLFLAGESSEFLYKFRHLEPYSSDETFGKKTYNLLRTVLATNTLLSKLAIAYNLHVALDDSIVRNVLEQEYIPYTAGQRDIEPPYEQARYEEEFIADYFEQYVGALYLEQPLVAKQWINQLFEQILFSISDSYKIKQRKKKDIKFDYRAWGMDVVGRSLK